MWPGGVVRINPLMGTTMWTKRAPTCGTEGTAPTSTQGAAVSSRGGVFRYGRADSRQNPNFRAEMSHAGVMGERSGAGQLRGGRRQPCPCMVPPAGRFSPPADPLWRIVGDPVEAVGDWEVSSRDSLRRCRFDLRLLVGEVAAVMRPSAAQKRSVLQGHRRPRGCPRAGPGRPRRARRGAHPPGGQRHRAHRVRLGAAGRHKYHNFGDRVSIRFEVHDSRDRREAGPGAPDSHSRSVECPRRRHGTTTARDED